jgi:hypothetical protein
LFADRTSTATMRANQLRRWFASMAYALICALRRIGLVHTPLANATCGTIRLKLLKLGALVEISAREVKIAFASAFMKPTSCPFAPCQSVESERDGADIPRRWSRHPFLSCPSHPRAPQPTAMRHRCLSPPSRPSFIDSDPGPPRAGARPDLRFDHPQLSSVSDVMTAVSHSPGSLVAR